MLLLIGFNVLIILVQVSAHETLILQNVDNFADNFAEPNPRSRFVHSRSQTDVEIDFASSWHIVQVEADVWMLVRS